MAKLYDVDVSDSPVTLGSGPTARTVTRFEVHSLSFVELGAAIDATAGAATMAAAEKAQRAQRRANQVRAFAADGARLELQPFELLQLPRMLYLAIMRGIEQAAAGEVPGKVIQEGDGVDKPVVYQLGKPIDLETRKGDDGKTETAQITELEFVAKTGLEIEDVLCEPHQVGQALSLIKNCARPIVAGGDAGLMRLPDWALQQITVKDGIAITEKVLPTFLG